MSSQGILSGDVIFHVICKDLFVILYFVPLTTAYPWLSASSMEVFFNSRSGNTSQSQLETVTGRVSLLMISSLGAEGVNGWFDGRHPDWDHCYSQVLLLCHRHSL